MSEEEMIKNIFNRADTLTLELNEVLQSGKTSISAAICAVISLGEQMREKHPDLFAECEALWHEGKVRS